LLNSSQFYATHSIVKKDEIGNADDDQSEQGIFASHTEDVRHDVFDEGDFVSAGKNFLKNY